MDALARYTVGILALLGAVATVAMALEGRTVEAFFYGAVTVLCGVSYVTHR